MHKDKNKYIVVLHIFFMLYSLFGIFSKYAAQEKFLSWRFIMYYGIVLLNLVVYAIFWQQMIKKMPLVVAYANKSVTVIWGIMFGRIFWNESISFFKILGACLIVLGIIWVVTDEEQKDD